MKRFFIDSAQDQITKKAVKESATNLVPTSSVLMVTRSGILSHSFPVAINTVDVAINQDLKAWTSLGAVEPTYAAYFLKARARNILQECSKDGTTVSSIDFDRLSAYPVAVAPAREQRRIVSKIDELFSRIDEGEQALKRVEKLVEHYRQSVLNAAVTGELTRDWRAARKRAGEPVESGSALLARIMKVRRTAWETAELAKLKAKGKPPTDDRWKQKYKEPVPPDTTDLPELPEGWVWTTLPQLGEFGRGKSKHRPRNDPKLYGGPYPFLQTGTVRTSRGQITSFDTTYNEQGLAQSKLWPRGTVCITIAANIAESGILDFDACFPNSIVGFVPSDGVVGEYVEFFVRTARDDLERYAPATAQKNINLEILEQVAIPLPPYAEQQRVLASAQEAMSKIDAVEHALGTESSRSAALRQSILKAAFSGQLVPQDPHDEPASKLLERIATERTNAVPTARKRKKKSA